MGELLPSRVTDFKFKMWIDLDVDRDAKHNCDSKKKVGNAKSTNLWYLGNTRDFSISIIMENCRL